MMPDRRKHAGFTLLELLLVITIIALLTAIVLSRGEETAFDQLRSTAQIVSTELSFGRGLAMANNTKYKFTFDTTLNRFILQHSGTNPAFNQLPGMLFRSPSDTQYQYVVNLKELPHTGPALQIAAVTTTGSSPQRVSDIEFTPLGSTTRTDGTAIWLMAGSGLNAKYITVTVDPVIGLCQIGSYTKTGPP